MSREFKFKVWDKVDYMSSPFTFQDLQEKIIQFTNDCLILQYTGLKDKNGKEIYEGDLIAEVDEISELKKWGDPLVIEFGHFEVDPDSWGIRSYTTGFFCRYREGAKTGIHNADDGYGFKAKEIMIVGNIYQHSHLLENGK